MNIFKWFLYVSYANHIDMNSHTGSITTMAKAGIILKSKKQNLNAKSSTEVE